VKANFRAQEIERILRRMESGEDSDDELEDSEGLKVELEELKKANDARLKKMEDYEVNKKWNVDNLCHVVEERTIINPKAAETKFSSAGFALPDEPEVEKMADTAKEASSEGNEKAPQKKKETKAEKAKAPTSSILQVGPENVQENTMILSYSDFVDKHADILEKWMTIKSLEKCKQFLLLHGAILLQENATNYLLLASLEDEMNGFREKMKLTARQSQILTNIAELAKSLKSHPGNVILPFFKRIQEKQYYDGFMEGVDSFIEKIIKRSIDKKKEMKRDQVKEETTTVDLSSIPKEERLGPGGLDPVEVFDSLPESLQQAFETREVDNLKQALLAMDPKDAEYHMKRCVDCGLWNDNS